MALSISELEKRLWAVADELRANSDLKASEYSAPVLGMIFLRYADYRFTKQEKLLAQKSTSRRKVSKTDYQAAGVMYLPDEARFSYLLNLPEGADIGKAINEAMKAVERENEDLKGILPKTYNRFDNSLLVELIKLMSSIPEDGEGAFDFGQVYVALSRCRSLEDIHLVRPIKANDIKCDPVIKRFYEALSN